MDAATAEGSIVLMWNSYFEPFSDWSSQPADPPRTVEIWMSSGGLGGEFEQIAERAGGIADTLRLSGLINGKTYAFRIRYRWSQVLASLPSRSIVAVPGSLPLPEYSLPVSPLHFRGSAAAWSPSGQEVAYARRLVGSSAIAILRLDGSSEKILSTPSTGSYLDDVAWSPDGTEIACTASPSQTIADIDYRVWIVTVNGPQARSVTSGRVDSDPAWDAHTGTIVYCRGTYEAPNIPELFRTASDSLGDPIAITHDPTYDKRAPTVRSSDGRIAFAGRHHGDRYYRSGIYEVSSGGGAIRRLIVSSDWNDGGPSWSPDGARMAFVSDRSGHDDVWIHDFTDGSDRPLTTGSRTSVVSRLPSWSPDGSRIAVFESSQDGTSRIDIYPAP
jgi:dipeptidyl aminopeptidase/acylaminoacyl peptidase